MPESLASHNNSLLVTNQTFETKDARLFASRKFKNVNLASWLHTVSIYIEKLKQKHCVSDFSIRKNFEIFLLMFNPKMILQNVKISGV